MTARPTRILAAAALALAMLLTPGGALPATAGADDPTTVRPWQLDRGANPGVPQVLGTRIIDGDTRIDVEDATEIYLLGTDEDQYVVLVYSDSRPAVERISPDGTREVVIDRRAEFMSLSDDGEHLIQANYPARGRTLVVARDSETGEALARRRFRGSVFPLDASEGRMVLSGTSPARTFWWNHTSNATKRIKRRVGYFADITADRLGVYTRNSSQGRGCSVLSTLSPRTRLWRTCDDIVLAASPNGRRVLTTSFLDGPVSTLEVHRARGRQLTSFRTARRASFIGWTWETNRSLLMAVQGSRRSTIVRCVGDECERATRFARNTF